MCARVCVRTRACDCGCVCVTVCVVVCDCVCQHAWLCGRMCVCLCFRLTALSWHLLDTVVNWVRSSPASGQATWVFSLLDVPCLNLIRSGYCMLRGKQQTALKMLHEQHFCSLHHNKTSHSVTHCRDLYSANSRLLLRSAPNQTPAKKTVSCLQ